MTKDIDRIIEEVRKRLPSIRVVQMEKVHPADDDGLWWFRMPGVEHDIQIESPSGNVPFFIEGDNAQGKQAWASSVERVVEAICDYYTR